MAERPNALALKASVPNPDRGFKSLYLRTHPQRGAHHQLPAGDTATSECIIALFLAVREIIYRSTHGANRESFMGVVVKAAKQRTQNKNITPATTIN